MNDRRTEAFHEGVNLIDIRAFPRAQAEMVKADTTLVKGGLGVFGIRRRNRDARSTTDALEVSLRIEENLHLEEFEERRPEGSRPSHICHCELDMGDPIELHRGLLRRHEE
jgi:hypothetical protein